MFMVTYLGEGVASNKLGVFQNGTTAYTGDELLARELSVQDGWRVTDQDGTLLAAPRETVAAASFPTEAPREERHGKRQKHRDQPTESSSES